MNFMKAKLIRKDDQYSVEVLGVSVPLDAEKCAKLAGKNIQTMEIKLGVRPEHTTVCFDSRPNAIIGTIAVNEMMGSEVHLHVRTADDNLVILRLPTIDLTNEQRANLMAGNPLGFAFTSKVVHLFDPQTEESLLF